MVLGAITVLEVMLAETQTEASAELASAYAEQDAVRAEYSARSAVNLTRLLIASEPTIRKSLAILAPLMGAKSLPQLPVWELAGDLLGAFNDGKAQAKFSALAAVNLEQGKNLGLSDTAFEVEVVPEDAKINVNLPARGTPGAEKQAGDGVMALIRSPEYDPMFEERDEDGNYNQRATVCGAIVDWADPNQDGYTCEGDTATAGSAISEDAYYQRLKQPYQRKNAAFDSLEELRLVRGIDDDFWATFVQPEPDDPKSRNVTVWGSGQVNVNSASPYTIWALVCGHAVNWQAEPFCTDPMQRMTFFMLMNMAENFTAGVPLFTTPKTFVRAITGKGKSMAKSLLVDMFGLTPISQIHSENYLLEKLSVDSKVFSIYATGVTTRNRVETRVKIHAVVDFRQAPPPGMSRNVADLMQASGLDASSSADTTAAAPSATSGSATLAPDALLQALTKDPGGNVIYYRVD